jgi:hypothetical protein
MRGAVNADRQTVLKTLAAGGQRADVLASAICDLVVKGAPLGELEVQAGVKVFPTAWLSRLAQAIELGVLDKPKPSTLRHVVDRILIGDES